MNKLKLTMVVFGMLAISSCDKSSEDLNENSSNTTQAHALGAKLVDLSTYNSFQKANIDELVLKYKGRNAKNALSSSYFIPGLPTVQNQGNEGSCVAWATAYAATSALDYNFRGVSAPRSPEYVYNQIKQGDCSSGASISAGLELIRNQGVCSWNEMPYNDGDCYTMPNISQRNAASTHRFAWGTVDKTNINNVKVLLNMNLPIIVGITIDGSFDSLNYSTGWTWRFHSGYTRGGHAVAVIGYDDAKQAFKIQNSWGSNWGDNGYAWIDYSFFAQTYNGAINECYVAYN